MINSSKTSSSGAQQLQHLQQQPFLPGAAVQMAGSSSGKVSSNTGSLVNFNLSTIFPEINIPAGVVGANCQSKPLVGLPALPPPEFLQGSRSGQLGTPDLIPHSITLLGHTSHQVPTFSVASNMVPGLSTNMVPGLPFPNLPE